MTCGYVGLYKVRYSVQEILDLNGDIVNGLIWLPYNVVFPIGDLDMISLRYRKEYEYRAGQGKAVETPAE
jgi:hypothetical protein